MADRAARAPGLALRQRSGRLALPKGTGPASTAFVCDFPILLAAFRNNARVEVQTSYAEIRTL